MTPEARALLDWYDANARDLPWRAPPGAPPMDPYRVWLPRTLAYGWRLRNVAIGGCGAGLQSKCGTSRTVVS